MIIVSGATGFLGGAVVRALKEQGHHVVGLGRNKTKLEILPHLGIGAAACELSSPRLSYMLDGQEELKGEVDAIVHCAALSAPFGSPRDFMLHNVEATRNLARFAVEKGVRRFVHISSPSVYFKREDQLAVSESDPLPNPFTEYARTKAMSERVVMDMLPGKAIVLRPRGIYGPGDTSLIPRLVAASRKGTLPLLRDGVARTDVTYVSDVVGAVIASLEASDGACDEIYNISGGDGVRIKEIIDQVAGGLLIDFRWKPVSVSAAMAVAKASELVSAALGYRFEPPITRYGLGILAYTQTLDVSKARQQLGWSPQVPFDEGFARTMEYMQK